jgi:hypothetical protein
MNATISIVPESEMTSIMTLVELYIDYDTYIHHRIAVFGNMNYNYDLIIQ